MSHEEQLFAGTFVSVLEQLRTRSERSRERIEQFLELLDGADMAAMVCGPDGQWIRNLCADVYLGSNTEIESTASQERLVNALEAAGVEVLFATDTILLWRERSSGHHAPLQLSPREQEVWALLTDGKTSQEVALALGLSVRTAEGHARSILKKMGLRRREELL